MKNPRTVGFDGFFPFFFSIFNTDIGNFTKKILILGRIFETRAEALQLVLKECKSKAKIVDICEKGDSFIRE